MKERSFLGLSKNVRNLGWVSLFNDILSEMIYDGLAGGTERAWVADLVEESRRGTACGAYPFSIGMAALPASLLMGLIWKAAGVKWAFSFSAVLASIAALLAILLLGDQERTAAIESKTT